MGKNLTQLDQIEEIKGTELTYVLDVANGKDNAATIDQLKQYIADNKGGSDYVTLKGDDGVAYRVFLKNNKLCAVKDEAYTGNIAQEGQNATVYDGLIINHMYGAGTDSGVSTPVSHSFVELYNLRNEEVNLRGLYLFYRAKAGNWEGLKLEGIVPPKHSFLIRGKQQMDPYDPYVTLPILDYDMEWDKAFSNKGFSMYLCIGGDTPEDSPVRYTYDTTGAISSTNKRFIDLLGAGGKSPDDTIWAWEGKGVVSLKHDSYLHCMDKNTGVHRRDFCSAASKYYTKLGTLGTNATAKGNNEADCEAIDYTNCDTTIYRPRCLNDGRWNEFYDKLSQSASTPSMINISYGKEGDTSRCFCFHTKVTNEGYVYYKKQSEQLWNVAETTIKIVKDMEGCTAVHKVKISGLSTGIYDYKVGYEGCWSDQATFEVKDYSSQSSTIKMLWTSDQQSWTNKEYDAWKIAARFLRKNNGYRNYDFYLNTGVNVAPYIEQSV